MMVCDLRADIAWGMMCNVARCQLVELAYLSSYILFTTRKELTYAFPAYLFILQGFRRHASI